MLIIPLFYPIFTYPSRLTLGLKFRGNYDNLKSIEEKIKKPKRRSRSKPPKVILQFDPSPNFEEEFLEFVETVLSWNKKEKNL